MHGGCDGSFGSRRLFNCPPNQGLFAQLNEVIKYDDFLFANPGKENYCYCQFLKSDLTFLW